MSDYPGSGPEPGPSADADADGPGADTAGVDTAGAQGGRETGPPASPTPAPVAARPLPAPSYHLLHLGGWPGWWRPAVGIALAFLLGFVVMPVAWLVAFGMWFALTGQPILAGLGELADLSEPTPTSLAYINLSLASMIPVAWLCQRLLHGLKPGWLSSVMPRLRWGYFVACFGIAFVALLVTVVVSAVLPIEDAPTNATLNEWTPRLRDFLLVVLLLTPFQAAAEEYLFRGYLTQAVGGIFYRVPWLAKTAAVVVPAVLFALVHGAQTVPVFIDRLAFGLLAGVLVIATGGLEAAIAMHILNNIFAFGLALAYGDMATTLNPTSPSWWQLPVTLTQTAVYLALALGLARVMGVSRTAELPVLAASRGLVYRDPSRPPD